MEIEKKIAWLKPERIQKLYTEHKNLFGINRMLIIGIGRNGVDCALACKHLTVKRFGSDEKKMRFLGIAEEKLLKASNCEGTFFGEDEQIPIVPEDAIYKYLNHPERLPQYALDKFDNGLKNYSPATPTYGLTKRQCGRIALFHNIKPLTKRIGECVSAFSGSDKSLEIVITGNMGDAFFGGMFIDLAFIVKTLFEGASYPIKVNCCMFAPDTAEFCEKEQRDLGNYYANTIVTKKELDMFQCMKKPFSQRYSGSLEVVSDKPPFNACFIAKAENNYPLTISTAAEKILARMEILFSKDDDAERIMSYNMLKSNENHDFRYLSYGVSVVEVPLGKIISYLGVKVFTALNHLLNKNNVGQMLLGQYSNKVTPDAMYLASKAGEIPKLEFDEKTNPTFSAKALKISSDASLNYVNEWLDKIAAAAQKGAEICEDEIVNGIIADCEAAKTDMSKGPFYSIEIVRKCLSELRVAIAKTKSETEDMGEQVKCSRNLVNSSYMKLKTSALFAAKAAEQYIFELNEFAEFSRKLRTGDTLVIFYQKMYNRLNEYLSKNLSKASEAFENIAMNRAEIIAEITADSDKNCVTDAFSVSDPRVSEKLDKLVETLPEERLSAALKSSGILELPDDDETALAKAIVNIVAKCFDSLLAMNFSEMCEYFEVEASVGGAVEQCIKKISEENSESALNRIICPKSTKQDDISALRATYKGMSYIWNGSVMKLSAAAVRINGGAKLEQFKDYNKWENMHYAYVNDSLKKHGIHIFR